MSSNNASENHNPSTNCYPSINIIGAGIAGLSLACHLRRRRIPFNIFDSATKPKGHNYGITISPWAYKDVLPALEPKLDTRALRELTAVDRVLGGIGVTTFSNQDADEFRASDMALREVLAKGHHVNWNYKVISAENVTGGLKLKFENGEDSIAKLTIDAGGERSGFSALLLPELKPEVLPYAVYHGSRYIPQSVFDSKHSNIFQPKENVKSFPPAPSSAWQLQIAKSHITKDQLPSKINIDSQQDEPIVEFRYTFSRPATTTTTTNAQSQADALFNPSRAKHEATQIPAAFHSEISNYVSSQRNLPDDLQLFLNTTSLQHDRILNWLMRLKPTTQQDRLSTLASKHVIAIGDSAHATPPLGSYGASYAMVDATRLADWIERECSTGEVSEHQISRFYHERSPEWLRIKAEAAARLQEMHVQHAGDGKQGRLSGHI